MKTLTKKEDTRYYKTRIYCPRNKKTGEYLNEQCYRVSNIFELLGWRTIELCKREIASLNEPDEWEVVEVLISLKTIKVVDVEEV